MASTFEYCEYKQQASKGNQVFVIHANRTLDVLFDRFMGEYYTQFTRAPMVPLREDLTPAQVELVLRNQAEVTAGGARRLTKRNRKKRVSRKKLKSGKRRYTRNHGSKTLRRRKA